MRALAVAVALLAPPVTHDVVPVYIAAGGTGFITEYVTTVGARQPQLAGRLRVFRRPRAPFRDLLPPELQQQLEFMAQAGFGGNPRGSRLMLVRDGVRIYGLPASHGQVCVFVLPDLQMQCWSALQHGATPVVDARRDVWGLVGDTAQRVDVGFAAGTLRAAVGTNAFYLRLPRHVVAPQRIVVTDRDGARHVYTVKRCRVGEGDAPFIPAYNPLTPPPSPC
jgi:hypothetical protein